MSKVYNAKIPLTFRDFGRKARILLRNIFFNSIPLSPEIEDTSSFILQGAFIINDSIL